MLGQKSRKPRPAAQPSLPALRPRPCKRKRAPLAANGRVDAAFALLELPTAGSAAWGLVASLTPAPVQARRRRPVPRLQVAVTEPRLPEVRTLLDGVDRRVAVAAPRPAGAPSSLAGAAVGASVVAGVVATVATLVAARTAAEDAALQAAAIGALRPVSIPLSFSLPLRALTARRASGLPSTGYLTHDREGQDHGKQPRR